MPASPSPPKNFDLVRVFKVVILKFTAYSLSVGVKHCVLIFLTCLFGFILAYFLILCCSFFVELCSSGLLSY